MSPEGELDTVVKLLEMHFQSKHTLAVQASSSAKHTAVNRAKMNSLKQQKGESIRKYAERVRSLATVSGYSLPCHSCETIVSILLMR